MITEVDDDRITDSDSLVATVRTYRPGDKVTADRRQLHGNGESTSDAHTIDVTLGSDAD